MTRSRSGFTLIELLIALAVIGVLVAISAVATTTVRKRSRDAKRKYDLNQINRLMSAGSCYIPTGGPGDYDLTDIFAEMKASQVAQSSLTMETAPRDPSAGGTGDTRYRYTVNVDGTGCSLYANLENQADPVTLPTLTAPTPGAGTGVLQASAPGVNGTRLFFQVSNR